MFSRHVTRDISAYCHGELSGEESKQFAEHIIACASCRTKFEEVKLGIKLAEQLPELAAPDHLWSNIEQQLATAPATSARNFFAPWQLKIAAAVVIALLAIAALWFYNNRRPSSDLHAGAKPSWRVRRIDGTPKIGSQQLANFGQLGIGEWLETDGSSSAEIAVGTIGSVDIDANTRVRLLQTKPTEHRLELARGKMSARIWAPPRLFFVDTPSAVAADMGCAYTLEVDDHGASLLRVTSGWVALQLKERESMVPAGAACETKPGIGPGTPYFEDASPTFRQALKAVDFDSDASNRSNQLTSVLNEARPRDTLTLYHLLARVDGEDRVRVYERMAVLVPPPAGVTRESVLQLDEKSLQSWKHTLEPNWMLSDIWKIKKGLIPKEKMAPQ